MTCYQRTGSEKGEMVNGNCTGRNLASTVAPKGWSCLQQ